MESEQTINGLRCHKCNTVLVAPTKDREIAQCKCKNRAWIQKRPDGQFWAYGSVNPMAYTRLKPSHEKSKS